MRKYTAYVAGAMLLGATAFAQDGELREQINCFPAKNIRALFENLQALPPESRTIVDTELSIQVAVLDGGVLPQRAFARDGEVELDMGLREDGEIMHMARLVELSEAVEFCGDDPSRVGQPADGDTMQMGLTTKLRFLKQDGTHSLADMEQGAKDGRDHYKALFGGGLKNMFIPKLTHMMVVYDEPMAKPDISVLKGEEVLSDVTIEGLSEKAYLVALKDMKKTGADSLTVAGGGYSLTPVPNAKKLKSLGIVPE